MDERQVYEMQQALRDKEMLLDEEARRYAEMAKTGAPVGTQDYWDGPLGREVRATREQVKLAQDAIGGVVYRVPVENLGALREDLAKLVKRANKLGVGEVSYRVSETVERVESKIDPLIAHAEMGYIPRFPKAYRFVVLNAGVVKLEGWMLLAALTIEPGGVMISKVPAFARAWALHREGATIEAPHYDTVEDPATAAAQEALDKISLVAYADPKTATRCDHCGLSRRRTKTYLVEQVETGEVKQVGANCLRDFLGVDPHALVKYATWLSEIDEAAGDEERYAGSGRVSILTEEYLTHVCAMIRTEGWVSRSEYRRATADAAWQNLYAKKDEPKVEITADDHERAVAAIEWAKDHLGAKVHQSQNASEFEHNLYVAANGETMPKKGDGIVAYLPVAHAKFEEREIERKEREKTNAEIGATSTWVGQAKDRIVVTATVLSIYEKPGDWGTTFITKLLGDDGNVYKWFASYDTGRGNKITGKFTVKKHDEYNGVKETVITRPHGLEVIETADGETVEFFEGETVRDPATGIDYKVLAVNIAAKTLYAQADESVAPVQFNWCNVENMSRVTA